MKNIQDAYTGTDVTSQSKVAELLATSVDVNSPTAASTSYSQSIVDIALSTKAKTTVAIANSCAPQPNYLQASYQTGSPESIEKVWQNSDNTA